MDIALPRIVIVGGGFGGLTVAKELKGLPAHVTLVDKSNHHLFQPLLYQVATAALSPADIAMPIRRVMRGRKNAHVMMAEATAIDLSRRVVQTNRGELSYDHLVIAAGATHAYFGHEDWAVNAPGLKTVEDALEIRRRILTAFEAAELEDDDALRAAKLTFVVVGGGPTGVELAGAIREIAADSIPADFRRVDTTTAKIVLVEGEDRLLPSMSEAASEKAFRQLEGMGVEVRLGARVNEVDPSGVWIEEERVEAENVIWAAGVQGAALAQTLGVPLDEVGRVRVEADCSLPGHPEAFVIGDLAALDDPASGFPVPGVAPAAIQMGKHVAGILRREVGERASRGRREAFRYRDKGTLATIGKARAVADFAGRTFGGLFAWLLWSMIHIAFLIGFRNRFIVMLSWAWNYAVHLRGARLITGTGVRKPNPVGPANSVASGHHQNGHR